MGNKATGPITEKKIQIGANSILRFVNCEMQGWREYMVRKNRIIFYFQEDASLNAIEFDKNNNSSIFGIFDGHGGPIVSKFAASNFVSIFERNYIELKNPIENSLIQTFLEIDELLKNSEVDKFLKKVADGKKNEKMSYNLKDIGKFQTNILTDKSNKVISLNKSFSKPHLNNLSNINLSNLSEKSTNVSSLADQQGSSGSDLNNVEKHKNLCMKNKNGSKEFIGELMGSTANIIFIEKNVIYVANVGDSYSVMFKNKQAIKLNIEHKTSDPIECQRVYESGSKIINDRVDGKLNLTRALGDFCFKSKPNLKPYEQAVTAYPEINKYELTDDVEFIIMGCDGIWDCVEVQKFCEFISKNLNNKSMPLNVLLPFLLDKLLSKTRDCKY